MVKEGMNELEQDIERAWTGYELELDRRPDVAVDELKKFKKLVQQWANFNNMGYSEAEDHLIGKLDLRFR